MTRVLIVLTSNERRGAEVEGSQLADELSRAGHEAVAVALSAGASAELDVGVLGPSPFSFGTLRALRARARACDVVVAFGSTSLPACAIALAGCGTPFVYRSIGDPVRWVRGGWHRRRTGLLFRRAAQVVALWPGAAESISALYGVNRRRVSCIANARSPVSDREPMDRTAARAQLGLPIAGTVVAWVGALSEEKRPRLAVEAVAAHPDAFLALAGAGALRGSVVEACEALLPGRHRLLGVVGPLAPVWAAADVVLLTSRTEGMPGVLIEAALHGVPAVATDVGGVAEVVADGESGLLVAPDATAAVISQALSLAIEHSAEFGVAAQRRAEAHFTWATVLPEWLAVVERVGKLRHRG